MKITVVGCGRWGSLITWYLDSLGHEMTLYGRESSPHLQRFMAERKNDLLTLSDRVSLTSDLSDLRNAEVIVISIGSQGLRALMQELVPLGLKNKIFVLCCYFLLNVIACLNRISNLFIVNTRILHFL